MILSENILNAKSKGQSFPNIKQINLCGMHLSDVSIMQNLRQLEVAVLSVNDLTTLVDFEDMPSLTELHVRKNQIADITEIKFLKNLPKLKLLSLIDNPCVENAGRDYRLQVIHTLPNLKILDNIEISQTERTSASDPKYEIGNVTPQVRPRRPESTTMRFPSNNKEEIIEPTQQMSRSSYDSNSGTFEEKSSPRSNRRPDIVNDTVDDRSLRRQSIQTVNVFEERRAVFRKEESSNNSFDEMMNSPRNICNYNERYVVSKKQIPYDERPLAHSKQYEYNDRQGSPLKHPYNDEQNPSPRNRFQNYDDMPRQSALNTGSCYEERSRSPLRRRNSLEDVYVGRNQHSTLPDCRQPESPIKHRLPLPNDRHCGSLGYGHPIDDDKHSLRFCLMQPRTGKSIQSFNLESEGSCILAACLCLAQTLDIKELRELQSRIEYKIHCLSNTF